MERGIRYEIQVYELFRVMIEYEYVISGCSKHLEHGVLALLYLHLLHY